MNRFSRIIAIIIGLCMLSSVSWASEAYVTDNFRISLRRGPSIENKILKFLPSGQPVEILETQEGWSRIRPIDPDQGNLEGWVLSRYIISRLPWENQVRSLKEVNSRLSMDLALVEKKYKETALREQAFSKEVKKYADAFDKSRMEYTDLKKDSSKYLDLKSAYETLQGEAKKLKEENEMLERSQRNKWFAMGALILLCGLIIGILFGRQEKKRKSYY